MFIVLRERILRAFNSSSKELQSSKMDLSAACRLLNCTKNQLQHIRESWDSVVETATAISHSWNIKVSFLSPYGVRTRNANEYDTAFEDHSHSFKVKVFYKILDITLHELNTRFKGHQSVMQLFSFLYPQSIVTCSNDEIRSYRKWRDKRCSRLRLIIWFYFVWYDSIIFLIIFCLYLDGSHIVFTHLDSEIFAICFPFAFQPFLRYWNLGKFESFKIMIFYIHCF